MEKYIYPSVIDINISSIEKELKPLDQECPGYHIDIMDGEFVHISNSGVAMANAVASHSMKTKHWAHLMVNFPQMYVNALTLAPGSCITFHFESQYEIKDIIKSIREKKWMVSIAIKPKTAPEKIFPFLSEIDQVMVMSVEPGYSGQPFLPESIEKVQLLAAYRDTSKLPFRIGIDGGINKNNIKQLAQLGADDFAVASAVFAAPDRLQALRELKDLIK